MPSRQKLPPTGVERENLRQKGQFWTPDWIAEAMVAYPIAGGHTSLFDPAVGAGAFFHAARLVAHESGREIALRGTEVDVEALDEARRSGLINEDLACVDVRDFVLNPPQHSIPAIVANPPYIRHHRLSQAVKAQLRAFGERLIGAPLDGRAGLHNYFLLRALALLAPGGHLAFILPADTVEGVSARRLWSWIVTHYCLEAVITFTPEATPFPHVDTNALIFLVRNAPPTDTFLWVKCLRENPYHLTQWILSRFNAPPPASIEVHARDIREALQTGISRPPQAQHEGFVLADFARVMCGIATGANAFFFLTQQRAQQLDLPDQFLIPALGRTRDVVGDEITDETLRTADAVGRPTRLFAPDGRTIKQFPQAVQKYLDEGVQRELPQRPLISQRKPWYRILFAYLGRRSARFIRNRAGLVPRTCFLCIYPYQTNQEHIEKLWRLLRHPQTIANLALVGKSYGSGAIKVEPRALEQLPLPSDIIQATELTQCVTPTTARSRGLAGQGRCNGLGARFQRA